MQQGLKGIRPPETVQTAVRELVENLGEARAVEQLGLSRQSVARLALGLRVQRGTVAMARLRLGMGDADAA
jgi:hypothetical protein